MSGSRQPPRITAAEPAPVEGNIEILDEHGRVRAVVPVGADASRQQLTRDLEAALGRARGHAIADLEVTHKVEV